MKLELDVNEVQFILNVLGQLPTSSNAYVLWKKIEEQAIAQVPKEAPAAE
jgi:hypothetical protein